MRVDKGDGIVRMEMRSGDQGIRLSGNRDREAVCRGSSRAG